MIRRVHRLGSTATVLLALAALIAPAASAHVISSEGSPTTLTGSQKAEQKHTITMNTGSAITCQVANFKSTMGKTPVEDITVSPVYEQCIFGSNSVTVSVKECTYLFTLTTNAGDAPVHIQCPAATTIEFSIPAISCVLDIAAQSPPGGISYQNEGLGSTRDILLRTTLQNVKVTPTGGFFCNLHTSAQFTGAMTLTGESDPGTTHTGVWFE